MTFSPDKFKSAQNILISRLNVQPELFTTAELIHDYGQENNMVAIGARVENRDTTNSCTVRLHSPNGTARVIPASTARRINEWFEQIYITPNAVTGDGSLQVELVTKKDALRPDGN